MNSHQKTVIQAACYLASFASVIESLDCAANGLGISESDVKDEVAKIMSLSKKLLKDANVTVLSGPLADRPHDILDN